MSTPDKKPDFACFDPFLFGVFIEKGKANCADLCSMPSGGLVDQKD